MKFAKRIVLSVIVFVVCAALCGCSVKLTTVRPSEICQLRVERLQDGKVVTLPYSAQSAQLKDELIFQLEEPYRSIGRCPDEHEHKYEVVLYITTDGKVDTTVYLNEDGTVCRGGKQYTAESFADCPVQLSHWDALFTISE